MLAAADARTLVERFQEAYSEPHTRHPELDACGVVEKLKEDFGDYSDPLMFDWSWREPD